jgi:hypothetical protein
VTQTRQTTVSLPPGLDQLLRIVNLLPKSIRCPDAGIHELAMRSRITDGVHDTGRDWFYFWRYIDSLPLALQAFVLHDDHGAFTHTDQGLVPTFDPGDLQPIANIDFPGCSTLALEDMVSKAKARVHLEIKMWDESRKAFSNERILGSSRQSEWRQYEINGSTFAQLGPDVLYKRTRQRFFFLLTADEVLYALTTADPQSGLDNLRYEDECALNSYLFVANDEVHSKPPALFALLVGTSVSRIERCCICEHYYWASRTNKKVCSIQCGATKRKRQERKRYLAVKMEGR